MTGTSLDQAVAEAIGDIADHDYQDTGEYNEYGRVYRCSRCGDIWLTDADPSVMSELDTCIRPFSTDMNCAMWAAGKSGLFRESPHEIEGAVERTSLTMRGRGYSVYKEILIGGVPSKWWTVSLAKTPALAICRAILEVSDG